MKRLETLEGWESVLLPPDRLPGAQVLLVEALGISSPSP